MRYLESNEIWEWCADRGMPIASGATVPPPDARLVARPRIEFGVQGPSGRERAVAASCVEALGAWDSCLVWIVLVGVWPSSEDWPAYYARRGARGERRALDVAPGHLYTVAEATLLIDDLAQLMAFGWEAYVLPAATVGDAPTRRVFISHDGWLRVDAAGPVGLSAAG